MHMSRGFAGIILLLLVGVIIVIAFSFSFVKQEADFPAPQFKTGGY
jgi:hypothetical protein